MLLSISVMELRPTCAEVRVVGSDLLGAGLTDGLLEAGGRAGLSVRVTFDGSLPGRERLERGTADFGLLVVEPDREEQGGGNLISRPLAYFAVAVTVAVENPLAKISLPQLAMIFGPRDRTATVRWGDLGSAEPWAGRPVEAVAPDPADGIGSDLFRRRVLGERVFRDGLALRRVQTDPLKPEARNPNVLEVMSVKGARASGLKVVPVSADARWSAYLPDAHDLHAGDYPLRLTLRLVYRRELAAQVQPLLEYLAGEAAAGWLLTAGWIPLPAEARNELARSGVPEVKPRNGFPEK